MEKLKKTLWISLYSTQVIQSETPSVNKELKNERNEIICVCMYAVSNKMSKGLALFLCLAVWWTKINQLTTWFKILFLIFNSFPFLSHTELSSQVADLIGLSLYNTQIYKCFSRHIAILCCLIFGVFHKIPKLSFLCYFMVLLWYNCICKCIYTFRFLIWCFLDRRTLFTNFNMCECVIVILYRCRKFVQP